ncbi:MAG: 4a-hydroxytetrahydrobiopterin dehydratase [Chlamydiota bacterium]
MGEPIKKRCTPCAVATSPLKKGDLDPLYMQSGEGWETVEEDHLEKSYSFKNFKQALTFVAVIGAIAEEEGHHPDIFLAAEDVSRQGG